MFGPLNLLRPLRDRQLCITAPRQEERGDEQNDNARAQFRLARLRDPTPQHFKRRQCLKSYKKLRGLAHNKLGVAHNRTGWIMTA